MIITALLENETVSSQYEKKHGLSLYVKTQEHNILFDLGPDETFIKNAEKMNIDLKEVNIVVISHGHNDHGGGLKAFLEYNDKAKIYIRKSAFNPHYTTPLLWTKINIGLDNELMDNERIIFTDDQFNIDENLCLFSNVKMDRLLPEGNKSLYKKENNKFINDDFSHEQNLLIFEDGEYTLLSGCSHCGIVNILDKAEGMAQKHISTAIGGFHLFKIGMTKNETVDAIGNELMKRKTKFYTCHCTGVKSYERLKEEMNDKIEYLKTGQTVEVIY